MKHYYLILCAALAGLCLFSCKNDEPQRQEAVTFHVHGLKAETQPMGGGTGIAQNGTASAQGTNTAQAPRKVAPLTDDDGVQMTDLILFDGSTYLTRQQSTDPNFGTVTVMLSLGEHHLHFIATRSTELTYENGTLSCASLRPTFGTHYDLTVNGGSDESVTLQRLTGQVVITIEDEIPAGASQLRIQFGDYCKGINPTTFAATRSGAFDQTVNIVSKVGMSNQSWTLNVFVPVYGTQFETTYTLTATNTSGDVIGQATGTMNINSNTKTLLHGNLFTGTVATFSMNTAWSADIDESF